MRHPINWKFNFQQGFANHKADRLSCESSHASINHVTVTGVKKYPDDVIEHPYPTVDKFIACSRPKYRVAGNTTTEANPLLSQYDNT